MVKPEVLLMWPTRPNAMAQLERLYQLRRYDEAEDKMAFLTKYGPSCLAVATNGHVELSEKHLQHLSSIGIVSSSSAGFEKIDTKALQSRGIALTNTSIALRDDVADAVIMLTLACRRQLVAAHNYVQMADWGVKGMYPLTSGLRGKRAGIFGLGSIGQAIADRYSVMGLEIGYHSRTPKANNYTYFSSLKELSMWSDILVAVVPGGAETKGVIDHDVLRALGQSGTFINVSRGSVVNETALIMALEKGWIANAGLDVFLDEPTPNPRLTGAPNVTLYPHHASGTAETRDAMAQLMVDNLKAFFNGEKVLTPVYELTEAVK